ncbi:MAG: hypothetical protein DI584_13950 [Stenotrophomonas sp.]|jgi:hypothetical protein|nr:MAG: hypothetical protein DI584_13950 [Stenotrophomonas sp.]
MRKTLILAAMLAAAPVVASADELSYTYAEAGWTQLQINNNDLDDPSLDGAYLRGSFDIAGKVNLFAGYSQVHKSISWGSGERSKLKLSQPELGAGYHMSMSERVDFTTDIAWLRLNLEEKLSGAGAYNGTYKTHTNASRVTIGLRGKPSARTEAWIKGGALDGSDMDTEFVGVLGGQVKFNKIWGVVAEGQWLGDFTQYSVGVRASF